MDCESINEMIDLCNKGEVVKNLNEYFIHNNTSLRKFGVKYDMNKEERKEFMRCQLDPIYFIEHYCKLYNNSTHKYDDIKLTESQQQLIIMKQDIALSGDRLAGTSTALVLKCIYNMIFNDLYGICIAANKMAYKNFLTLFKHIYETIPYFLLRGVTVYGANSIMFENGSMLDMYKDHLGNSYKLVIMDCVCKYKENELDEFYAAAYPTVKSLNGHIIVSDYNDEDKVSKYYKTVSKSGIRLYMFRK